MSEAFIFSFKPLTSLYLWDTDLEKRLHLHRPSSTEFIVHPEKMTKANGLKADEVCDYVCVCNKYILYVIYIGVCTVTELDL